MKKSYNVFVGNITLEPAKIFKPRIENLDSNKKQMTKYHLLLTNAYSQNSKLNQSNNSNITNISNNIEEEQEKYILEENRKAATRFNIFNYKKTLGEVNSTKVNSNEEDLMKELLYRFDKQKIKKDDKLKNQINFMLKKNPHLTPLRNSKNIDILTHNYYAKKLNNYKTQSNIFNRNYSTNLNNASCTSGSKYYSSTNYYPGNNSTSIDFGVRTFSDGIKNLHKNFFTPKLDKNLYQILQTLSKEEKDANNNCKLFNEDLKNFKTNKNLILKNLDNLLGLSEKNPKEEHLLQKFRSRNTLVKNPAKIKNINAIEKTLFNESNKLFNKSKKELKYMYKNNFKIPFSDE